MLLAKLHNSFKCLTDAEKKIAGFILENPEKAVRMTARELAEQCRTAQSAVVRLSKTLGFSGYRELKIELAASLGRQEPTLPHSPQDDVETVFRKVFASCVGTLRDTLSLLDFDKLEAVSDAIGNAERVHIFGVGTSSPVAQDAAYRFSQMGITAYAYSDVLFMNVAAGTMKKGDVAIGVSHSGQTRAVVDAILRAKEAGALAVALTSFQESLLAKNCNYKIVVYSDEVHYPVEAVSARVAHMCVMDALMMTIGTKRQESLMKYRKVRDGALSSIRYKTEKRKDFRQEEGDNNE